MCKGALGHSMDALALMREYYPRGHQGLTNLPTFRPLGYTQYQHFWNQIGFFPRLLEYGSYSYPKTRKYGYEREYGIYPE